MVDVHLRLDSGPKAVTVALTIILYPRAPSSSLPHRTPNGAWWAWRLTLFITFLTIQWSAQKCLPPLLGQYPGTTGQRWLMPHMLTMATAKIGYPVTFFILVIPNYALLHDGTLTFSTSRPTDAE